MRLLVDGERFLPRRDPLLTSLKLEWLPEVVILGHEMLAEELERGVQRATVERRVRTIRVRRCQTIALVVDEKDASRKTAWRGTDSSIRSCPRSYCRIASRCCTNPVGSRTDPSPV